MSISLAEQVCKDSIKTKGEETMKKECKKCGKDKDVKVMLRYDTGEWVCFDCIDRVMFKEIDDVKLIKTIKDAI